MSPIIEFHQQSTHIDGLLALTMKQVTDDRGTVRELFRAGVYADAGIDVSPIAQINVTESKRGAVRGMHAEQMNKLLTVATGEVAAAWIDLRKQSPSFGSVEHRVLTPGDQMLVPAGVANGFQTLSDISSYVYAFDTEWQPGMPGDAVTPLDPDIDYRWPLPIDPDEPAMISAKDRNAPTFATWRAQLGEDS